MKIAFVGGGTMAEAMIKGILSKKVAQPEDISVGEVVEERCRALRSQYKVSATTSNTKAVAGSDLVVLAVKPQDLATVMGDIGKALNPSQAVVSIVAGARISTLVDGLGHAAVVRVMPNTPAQIGAGMSVWTATPQVDKAQREGARAILKTLGEEMYVAEEKYLDMATALSASGPGYVFLFLEALIDAGVYVGMPRPMARTLAVQTVLGSAMLVRETGLHPAQLRDMVTSPGGTTVEGLLALEEGGVRAAVINAVIAAYEKTLELGEG